jgi:fluoride exporter
MTLWILLAIGGAAGAVARNGVATWVQRRAGARVPWGTLTVNVAGSFLMGLVLTAAATAPFRAEIAALLAVGFLGDFTTFSAVSLEIATLAERRAWGRALAYPLASVGLGVAAVVAGMACGRLLQ